MKRPYAHEVEAKEREGEERQMSTGSGGLMDDWRVKVRRGERNPLVLDRDDDNDGGDVES